MTNTVIATESQQTLVLSFFFGLYKKPVLFKTQNRGWNFNLILPDPLPFLRDLPLCLLNSIPSWSTSVWSEPSCPLTSDVAIVLLLARYRIGLCVFLIYPDFRLAVRYANYAVYRSITIIIRLMNALLVSPAKTPETTDGCERDAYIITIILWNVRA